MIQKWIKMLHAHFGPPKPQVPFGVVQYAYVEEGMKGVVQRVKKSMSLKCNLRLATVKSGGPKNAVAWVVLPLPIPHYGSDAFNAWRFEVFIRQDIYERDGLRMVAFALAHEFSHLLLASTAHPLWREERFADLTAMYFGYDDFLHSHRFPLADSRSRSLLEVILDLKQTNTASSRIGYLSDEEIREASILIQKMRH